MSHLIQMKIIESKWSRNTTLIVSSLMLPGIEERRISKRDKNVKVKNLLRATIDDRTIVISHC